LALILLDLKSAADPAAISFFPLPSSSSASSSAMSDGMASQVESRRIFERNHPGGSIGVRLRTVGEVMQPLRTGVFRTHDCMSSLVQSVRDHSDAVCVVVDDSLCLHSVITPSDLFNFVLTKTLGNAPLEGDDCNMEVILQRSIEVVGLGHNESVLADVPLERVKSKVNTLSALAVVDERGWPIGIVHKSDL